MPSKSHTVEKYSYSFDARTGGPRGLQLWGGEEGALIAKVHFVDDDIPVPPPVLAPDLESAQVSFHHSALPALVDMLRNEQPVRLTINDQPPGFVFISTGIEPAGEGEIEGTG